jgi:hypothetical protein
MKRLLLGICLLFTLPTTLLACDICGCGVGSYYFGMMPQFHRNFVGIRYRFSNFDSHVGLAAHLATREYFQTTELWARYYVRPRLQILAFIPYSFNRQETTTDMLRLQGLNDMMLMANYNLLKMKHDSIPQLFKHNLWVGGGVKLPTGKHQYIESDLSQVANPNFQLGTGSLDFLTNLTYTIRYKKVGINADLTYKINTANKDQYHFGNRLTSNVSLFYVQKVGKVGIMPHAGVYIENSQIDKRQNKEVLDTGGYFVANTIGLELYYKRFSIGANYQTPMTQNLANGHIKAHQRGLIHLSFML